jgi:hypothetical protein
MARNKGTFSYSANYEVKMQAALDPRVMVEKKSELISKETWPYDGDTIYLYKGLVVSVQEENALYMLTDMSKITAADYSGWLRVDAGNAEQVEVVDNLTSDATDKALSAKQGKVLMGEITDIKGKITAIYTPKGSKDKYADLPTDANVGDVWNVAEAHDGHPAGTNYAWTGTEWDALGGSIDLSNYYNKTEVDAAIKVETDRATAKESELAQGIMNAGTSAINAGAKADEALSLAQQNESNIAAVNLILNGNNNPDDDITDTVGLVSRLEAVEGLIGTPAEDYDDGTLLSRLDALENLVTGGEGGEGDEDQTLLQKVNANTLAIASLQSVVGDNTKGLVMAVNTLNADVNTVGSVDYKINEAFKWVNVE